jgi:hypothetical protein
MPRRGMLPLREAQEAGEKQKCFLTEGELEVGGQRNKNNPKNEARAKVKSLYLFEVAGAKVKNKKCFLCKQRGSRAGAKVKNKK